MRLSGNSQLVVIGISAKAGGVAGGYPGGYDVAEPHSCKYASYPSSPPIPHFVYPTPFCLPNTHMHSISALGVPVSVFLELLPCACIYCESFVYRGWLLKVTHFEMDAKSMRERNNAQANTNQSSQVFLMCMPEMCLCVCVCACACVFVCV